MRAAKQKLRSNKHSLENLRRTCSTDRVLNLASVFERFGDTPEYAAAPMFHNQRLNKAIFLKHTLRAHERDFQTDRRMTVTKVVLPFAPGELALGGFSFFLNEPDIEKTLAFRVGGEPGSASLKRDLKILRIMDQLPTFDPFLLRERLKRDALSVSRCYFELSEADVAHIREYVQSEIQKIVSLAFAADTTMSSQAANMTDKLMTDETAASLEPLRVVLQLSGEEYRDGIFAWKGFLYYSWNIDAATSFMPSLQRQLLEMKVKYATRTELDEIHAIRRRVAYCLTYLYQIATDGVQLYRDAYKELIEGKPRAFRTFLKESPSRFLEVGEAFGMIMHIRSFWEFRFRGRRAQWLPVDEALDIFRDFDSHVSAIVEDMD